jgi:hypothetical protein
MAAPPAINSGIAEMPTISVTLPRWLEKKRLRLSGTFQNLPNMMPFDSSIELDEPRLNPSLSTTSCPTLLFFRNFNFVEKATQNG